jgi:hypothetical protein
MLEADRSQQAAIHEEELREARELLFRFQDGDGTRAKALRFKMFQMLDAREVASAAGFTLTKEAKAKLYDIQQDIIRAAIAADDRALGASQKTGTPPPRCNCDATYVDGDWHRITCPLNRSYKPPAGSGTAETCPHGHRYEDCCWKGTPPAPVPTVCASWCGDSWGSCLESGERRAAFMNEPVAADAPCFCTPACRDAGRPLHPATPGER